MTDLMVDIETLGTDPSSKVVSVAAVEFNDQITWNPKVWKLPWWIDQPVRTFNDHTIRFWFDELAKNPSLFVTAGLGRIEDTYPTSGMLHDLGHLLKIVERVWAKSPSFDGVILSHLAGTNGGREFPFPDNLYRKWRDVRVMEDYLSKQEIEKVASDMKVQAHDPLGDCMYQIKIVQSAWKKIGYPGDMKNAAPEQSPKSV